MMRVYDREHDEGMKYNESINSCIETDKTMMMIMMKTFIHFTCSCGPVDTCTLCAVGDL